MSSATSSPPQPGKIAVTSKFIEPTDKTLPALAVQVTQLVGSYMVWVGTTEESAENVQAAALQGSLLRDWACAMPPINAALPLAATNLFRSSSSDLSLSMAQRLARRYKKQVFLSVDVPPSFMTLGDGPKLTLAVEKAVVQSLDELEGRA